MRFIWLTWKDMQHPDAGGAEQVTDQICSRLVRDGHEVTMITSRPDGLMQNELYHGYRILRKGNRYSVYYHAWRTYRHQPFQSESKVIEEVNTIPFFTRLYTSGGTMVIYQMARIVWLYQYFFPLNYIGYLLEPIYMRIAKLRTVVTISNSSRDDLAKYGYNPKNTHIMSVGILQQPVADPSAIIKRVKPSIIAFGSIRPMKRTLDTVKAFELAKQELPNLQLTLAGSTEGAYAKKVLRYIELSPFSDSITVLGSVDSGEKARLLSEHHFIAATAIKEGWGLTITEAASQGTPAIAYNVDGQRDAVIGGETGILCKPSYFKLHEAMLKAFAKDFDYAAMQRVAWEKSKMITFDRCYDDFVRAIK